MLETFSLIETQTVSPWSCAFDSPYPLIKVLHCKNSNAKPYSKLQPTTLNGGGGEVVCILLMICIIGGAFLLGGLLFSRSVLTILQLVVAVAEFTLITDHI